MGVIFSRPGGARSRRALKYWGISGPGDLIPRRIGNLTGPLVNADSAMTHSAVWAAIRIRANLISTIPLEFYRFVDLGDETIQIDASPSPMMASPRFMEWRYSSQVELDRTGNSIGIIRERNRADNYPSLIELQPTAACTMVYRDNKLNKYRINGVEYDPENIWHEKQYTVSGLDMGLSPVAYAAFQIGQYQSIQQFASQWFMMGQGPRASLKNTEKSLTSKDIALAQETWRASQAMGEPFVHGNDWEYNLIAAEHASTDWLEAVRLSNVDVARFFDVPSDVIDAAVQGGPTITYANIVQKNLQFLIMHLGPAIARRENRYNELLPRPRLVRHNTDALLRLDPISQAQWIKTQIEARVITPNEGRAIYNRKPMTESDYKQFELAGLNKAATGALAGAEGMPTPAGTQTAPAPLAAPTDQGNSNG